VANFEPPTTLDGLIRLLSQVTKPGVSAASLRLHTDAVLGAMRDPPTIGGAAYKSDGHVRDTASGTFTNHDRQLPVATEHAADRQTLDSGAARVDSVAPHKKRKSKANITLAVQLPQQQMHYADSTSPVLNDRDRSTKRRKDVKDDVKQLPVDPACNELDAETVPPDDSRPASPDLIRAARLSQLTHQLPAVSTSIATSVGSKVQYAWSVSP